MSELREKGASDVDRGGSQQDDLSVPMWVWTLLGFVAVVAVIIVVIMWGARSTPPADEDGGAEQTESVTATQPAEAETMPAGDAGSGAAAPQSGQ